MYNVNYDGGADKDAYRDNKLTLHEWDIIHQGVAVMEPVAQLTTMVETTHQPMLGRVLPLVNRVMTLLGREVTVGGRLMRPHELVEPVSAGRKAVLADLRKRWVTDLKSEDPAVVQTIAGRQRVIRKKERLRKLGIATVLDPRYKDFNFSGSDNYDRDQVKHYLFPLYTCSHCDVF